VNELRLEGSQVRGWAEVGDGPDEEKSRGGEDAWGQ